jgi:putative toxin-antitoxin system antitoxin component (TIGR02293 family)
MSHAMAIGPRKKKVLKAHEALYKNAVHVLEQPHAALYGSVQPEISLLIHQIKRGFPIDKFEQLKDDFGVNREKLADVAGISLATLHRRKVASKHLTPDESEKIYRLEKLNTTALEVLGKKERVKTWFSTQQVVFEGKTPLEYADTFPGAEEVERVLRRMEHGVLL